MFNVMIFVIGFICFAAGFCGGLVWKAKMVQWDMQNINETGDVRLYFHQLTSDMESLGNMPLAIHLKQVELAELNAGKAIFLAGPTVIVPPVT